jgi:hypothetical protein
VVCDDVAEEVGCVVAEAAGGELSLVTRCQGGGVP